jgi:hypothetical protein
MTAKKETVTLNDGDIVLDAENRQFVIETLLLGLACLGEVQKAEIAFDTYEKINGERPKWFDLRGQDNGDGIALFADALRVLQ